MDYPTIIIIIIAIGIFLILRWFLRQLFQKYVSLRYPEVNTNAQQNSLILSSGPGCRNIGKRSRIFKH